MKLGKAEAARFLAAPTPGTAFVLIYGQNPARAALSRQDLVARLLGPEAEEEMRLARMTGAELRSEPARLQDAMRAAGFFPGPRAVVVTDAGEALTPVAADAIADWAEGDATLIVEAGSLNKGSKLRALAEKAPNAVAIAFYNDPPGRAEIEDALSQAGLRDADRDAVATLTGLAADMDPGEFRQLLTRMAIHVGKAPLQLADVEACMPLAGETVVEKVITALANGDVVSIGPTLHRLADQGVQPTTLCIAAARQFRALHSAASDPRGPDSGVAALRPPLFGPRRDAALRQIRQWGLYRIESALRVLLDTDLQLRSGNAYPAMALTERAFIRIAMLGRAR